MSEEEHAVEGEVLSTQLASIGVAGFVRIQFRPRRRTELSRVQLRDQLAISPCS